MIPFLIYKASAGSGKTFTICKAFVKEMLCNQTAYRHILAVTFTNKATNEMKQRIIANLADIAHGRADALQHALLEDFRQDQQAGTHLPSHVSNWLNQPDADARRNMSTRAAELLMQILHDYGRLSVMTIDSFFQRIIRTFAMETGLQASFELQLDSKPAMEQAVDLFLSQLEPGSDAMKWLCDMMEERMRDGQSWNCRKSLEDTGLQMLAEASQTIPPHIMAAITDKVAIARYSRKIRDFRQQFENGMQQDAAAALDVMQHHGLQTDDFKGKSRSFASYFSKVKAKTGMEPSDTARKACDCLDNWFTGKACPSGMEAAYHDGMNQRLCSMVRRWDTDHQNYHSACIILKNLSQMGLVADLSTALQQVCQQEEIFLNSQSNAWIQKIIDGADAPFIYERTGNQFRHFMIDEMQDTSHMQWDNLLPLLRNGLAQHAASWTVGDVKQAIYRFRNGDWHIMSRQIGLDIPGAGEKSLRFNFRSAPEVIEFNNVFFDQFTRIMASQLDTDEHKEEFSHIYADAAQQIPERARNTPGFVSLRFHPTEKASGDDWREAALNALPEHIMQLEQKGFRASDIAVLVRGNSDAARIARFMLSWREAHPQEDRQYVFDMLFNEALYIDDSGLVQFMLEALTFLVDPVQDINREALAVHARQVLERDPDDMMDLLRNWAASCRGLSVYQATARLAVQADLYRYTDDTPYLQAFLDFLFTYCRTHPVDAAAFLTFWEEHRHKEHLKMPETQDAIRLMTIHKSKGLEFGAVLMPFVQWDMCKFGNNDQAWLSTDGTPFCDMPLVLVPLKSKEIMRSTFAPQLLQEQFMSQIDSVNLLYVAFTRARTVLMADIPYITSDNRTVSAQPLLCQLIHQTCAEPGPDCRWTPWSSPDDDVFGWCSGTFEALTPPQSAAEAPGLVLNDLYRPVHGTPQVTLLRQHAGFFESDAPAAAARGVVLHELFSRIRTLDDLPQLLEDLAGEGKIDRNDCEALARFVQDACSDPEVRSWFGAGVTVKTEADLLLPDGTRFRPDRVAILPGCIKVIDYKFGLQQLPQHRQQVLGYMQTLEQMGYQAVEGYLWYVTLGSMVRVA